MVLQYALLKSSILNKRGIYNTSTPIDAPNQPAHAPAFINATRTTGGVGFCYFLKQLALHSCKLFFGENNKFAKKIIHNYYNYSQR